MSQELHTCSNCEAQYDSSFKFCPECGQNREEELTLSVLFYNTIANYFSFDARFIKSFIPLMTKPGFLPKKFVEGKRLRYIHPAQVYLFISVIFFFVFSFYIRESRSSIDKAMKEDIVFNTKKNKEKINKVLAVDSIAVDSIVNTVKKNMNPEDSAAVDSVLLGLGTGPILNDSIVSQKSKDSEKWQTNFGFNEKEVDSLVEAGATDAEIYKAMGMSEDAGFFKRKFYSQMLKFYKEKGLGAIYQTFFDSIPIAMFFLLPIFALLLKIFYHRKGRYAHHLVFSFYLFSFLFAVMAILLGINRWLFDIPNWIDFLIILSTFFYFLIGVKRFYGESWFISFLKSSVVGTFFTAVILGATIVLGIFSFMTY